MAVRTPARGTRVPSDQRATDAAYSICTDPPIDNNNAELKLIRLCSVMMLRQDLRRCNCGGCLDGQRLRKTAGGAWSIDPGAARRVAGGS
jgi:hypothetical protein